MKAAEFVKQNKNILILIIMFLFAIFFITKGINNITGFVIKEGDYVGIYSVNPSFVVEVDYDLIDYNIIEREFRGTEGLLKKVEKCEKIGDKLDFCIKHAIEDINEKEHIKTLGMEFIAGCDEGLTEGRIQKFCVRKDNELLYFNGESVEKKNIEYKFAIEFPPLGEKKTPETQ